MKDGLYRHLDKLFIRLARTYEADKRCALLRKIDKTQETIKILDSIVKCHFCARQPELVARLEGNTVMCPHCKASGPQVKDAKVAIHLWNGVIKTWGKT